jgi:hypothetical protein
MTDWTIRTDSAKIFAKHRPHIGDKITGGTDGTVTRVEGSICHIDTLDGPTCFLWCFHDGLNALHQWDRKKGGKTARCPGVRP